MASCLSATARENLYSAAFESLISNFWARFGSPASIVTLVALREDMAGGGSASPLRNGYRGGLVWAMACHMPQAGNDDRGGARIAGDRADPHTPGPAGPGTRSMARWRWMGPESDDQPAGGTA